MICSLGLKVLGLGGQEGQQLHQLLEQLRHQEVKQILLEQQEQVLDWKQLFVWELQL